MKNLKKLVSVIVTVAMLISSLAALSVSAATGQYGDVEESNSYYKAIKVLSGLGIVEGDTEGNFNPQSNIKRSEMVAMVCRMLGEETVAESSSGSTFDDVSSDHWAAGYIAWGVAGNIINGVGDNKFDPDANVKFQDAVVMVLRALGYERIAQRSENGGYPTGYLKVASQRGVLSNTSNFDGATAATREVVAQVIYNALTTPLVDISYYAPNPADDEYIIYDGKNGTDLRTVLTYTNEIYKVRATVENTSKTSENLRKDKENPKVELDITGTYDYAWADILDNQFSSRNSTIMPYVGDTEVTDYLGYTVEAYIAEDDNEEWVLLSVVPDSTATTSETVSANFEAYDEDSGVFEYYVNLSDSRTTKIDVDPSDLSVYYNGSLVTMSEIEGEFTSLENLLVNVANSITFMGPRNDDYNKIFVTDYAYRQVDSVMVEDQYVRFTSGGLALDPDERGDDTFIYNLYDADGNPITLEDVQEDDIFNIVAPLVDGYMNDFDNAPYMDIYVTNETVTGSVSEQVDEDTFMIEGTEYKVDGNASLKVGDEGIFYITIDGYVYDSDAASVVNKNYSFILACDSDGAFGVNTWLIKMFTSEGTIETYDIAATVRVYAEEEVGSNWEYNSTSYKRSDKTQDSFFASIRDDLVADEASEAEAQAKLGQRLVTYKTNASNEVTEIRFPGTHVSDFAVRSTDSARYIDDSQIFGSYDLDSNSKLFVTPVSEVSEGNYNVDEEDIELASFSTLDEDELYSAFTYMFDNDDYLGAAVVGEEVDASMKKSHLAVVKTRSRGIDADGSDVDRYTFIQSGETITKGVDYDEMGTVEVMDTGDVFRYAVNAEDEIKETNFIYDASTYEFDAGEYTYADYDHNDVAIVYGKVTEVKSNRMLIEGDESVPKLTFNESDGNTYALVDESRLSSTNKSAAVRSLPSSASIKESYGRNEYYVVALIGESGRFEDCVQIQKDTE